MAKDKKKKKGWGPGRSSFSLTQFAAVGLAAWLIWSRTDSLALTILVGVTVLLLVSSEVIREIVRLLIAVVRELSRCYVVFTRARVEMFREAQRTQRDRFRYGSRLELERARQDTHMMRSATKARKQLGAGQAEEVPVEEDEYTDIEYRLV